MENNKKEKTIYANAYKEVLVILGKLNAEDYSKIPQEYIDFFAANCNNEYEFYYDNSKTFEEQELLEDTEYILFGLFEKYGATEIQKKKIKDFRKSYYTKLEQEKKELYNPNDIFTKIEKEEKIENNDSISLTEHKKSFFTKFKNFIFKILHINQ